MREFWENVQVLGLDDCWNWLKGKDSYGYGAFKRQKTHRIAYLITRGFIPNGFHILHKCNNPGCCNPTHLRAGTHQENMQQAYAENRFAGRRKLQFSDEELKIILDKSIPPLQVTKMIKISMQTVRNWRALGVHKNYNT